MRQNKYGLSSCGLKTAIILIAFLGLSLLSFARGGIVINVRMIKCPWIDFKLGDRLEHYLSSINNTPTMTNTDIIDGNIKGHQIDFDGLLLEGLNQNCNFLVDVFIDRIDLEKRRIVVFPQILSRNRVYAVVTGTYRMIDVVNQRMLKLKDFKYEVKAKDRWHLYDDDPNDPDLNIPVDQKYILFRELEDKAARALFKDIKELSELAQGEHLGKN